MRDVLKTLRDPEVLRFFLLSSHYRGPINYSSEAQLVQADETLLGLYRSLKGAASGRPIAESDYHAELQRFHAAMDDDFNTPEALGVMQGVARELNSAKAAGASAEVERTAAALLSMGKTLGILQQDPDVYLKRGVGGASATDAEIEGLLAKRHAARAARDFKESDRIRDELAAAGIILEDKAGGVTEWRRS